MAENKNNISKSQKKAPPVVVIMGHVDHGKTTLLDYIRKTHVQAGESGGITQHVGAYQARIRPDDSSSLITFVDTPGHEAFSKMRSRGAAVADIAILVVAANDGVKPQTKEAITHIKKAGIPFIIAINKCDIEGVVIDKVKAQLAENEIFVEGYGGSITCVEISALKGAGVSQLLEMIELMWELEEEKVEKDYLQAIVIESYIDAQKGTVANLLVRSGQLKIGQTVYCQDQEAKIRSLVSDSGQNLKIASQSQPVQLLGFKKSLPVGALVTDSKQNVEKIEAELQQNLQAEETVVPEDETKKLKIVLKADVSGTLEAIRGSLSDEVILVGEGVGDINDSDILLAASTNARIIGFRVKVSKQAQKLAEMEEVKIESFDVIYHLLEELEKKVLRLIEPTINEEVLGEAQIIAEFKIKNTHIAGCKVTQGIIRRTGKFRVLREDKIIAEPRVAAMQKDRNEVTEVKTGEEVALVFRPDIKFKIDDKIVCYQVLSD